MRITIYNERFIKNSNLKHKDLFLNIDNIYYDDFMENPILFDENDNVIGKVNKIWKYVMKITPNIAVLDGYEIFADIEIFTSPDIVYKKIKNNEIKNAIGYTVDGEIINIQKLFLILN